MRGDRSLAIVGLLMFLGGCAMPSTTMKHADGRIYQCQNVGSGVIGTAQALIEHDQCVDNAKVRGFTEFNASKITSSEQVAPISLPDGWINKPPPTSLGRVVSYAKNPTINAQLALMQFDKKEIKNVASYVDGRKKLQSEKLRDAVAGDVQKTQIKGVPAYAFSVSGFSLNSGEHLIFQVTLIDRGSDLLSLSVWLPLSKYEGGVKAEVDDLPRRINGL